MRLTVILFLALSFPRLAWSDSGCVAIVDGAIPLAENISSAAKINLSPNMHHELEVAQDGYATFRNEALADQPPHELFFFRGIYYFATGYLGAGSEGVVYATESNGKKYTVKKFRNERFMIDNLTAAFEVENAGANILMPVTYDLKTLTALYRYVDGITVAGVGEADLRFAKHGLHSPVSKSTNKYIQQAFARFKKSIPYYNSIRTYWDRPTLRDYNVMVDLKNDELVIIDPR